MKTIPIISIVICSYNRASYIIEAIESLYNQTLAKPFYEVIVVDNNSSDNTAELVESFIESHTDCAIRYECENRQGASFARNTGAALAKGSLLGFMDDDAVATSDYLTRIVSFFEQHPNACGLGGRIIPRYIPAEPKWMSHFVSSLVGNFHYSETVQAFAPGKYPLESNMIVRKAAFDAVGGFNVHLPGVKGTLRIGGEGKDFFLRLKATGCTVYYDPAIVVHHVVEVNKLTPEYMYRVASGIGRGERVRTRQLGGMAFSKKTAEYFYKLAGSVALGVFYAAKGRPAQSWPVIKFRIDALKGLLGY